MKEAYYFSHDSNARHDPKITAMRGVYGPEGYAWFWILVEMMRESDNYKLEMRSKYAYHAFASQMQCEPEKAQEFIRDCIQEFRLFVCDDTCFWSTSLMRRMEKRDKKKESAKKAADIRWGNEPAPDKDSSEKNMQGSNIGNANAYADACENDALKESKGKESKRNIKDKNICVDPPSAESHVDDYHSDFERFWEVFPKTRRRDKAKAYSAWKKKVKATDREDLIRCTELYAKDTNVIGKDGAFAKMPTSYLNAGTYKDYLQGGIGNEEYGGRTGGQAGGNQAKSEFAHLDDNEPFTGELELDPSIL